MYVLPLRVTDPQKFPKDLIENDVGQALLPQGIDVDAFFEAACQVTGEWKYERAKSRLVDRIQQKFCVERAVPLKARTVEECLNPQPDAQVTIQAGG